MTFELPRRRQEDVENRDSQYNQYNVSLNSASGDSSIRADQDFLQGPRLLLVLAGIQCLGRFNVAYLIVAILWAAWLFQFVYAIEQLFANSEMSIVFQRIGNLIWCFHSTVVYSIVTRGTFPRVSGDTKLYHTYFSATEKLQYAGLSSHQSEVPRENERKHLKVLSWVLSALSIGVVVANTAIVAYRFIGDQAWDAYFPIPHSVGVTVSATVVWYFFSYGWSLSIVLVCLPTYVFTLRVLEFVESIEKNEPTFDVPRAMLWYDDLFHFNRILNDLTSPLVTTNVALCFPLTVFLILSYSHDEVSNVTAVVWIIANTVIILLSTGCVANLYAINYRISMALGQKSTSLQFKDDQMAAYQLALLKIQAIPLGVRFFATRQFITPSIVFRAMALIFSLFVFLRANV